MIRVLNIISDANFGGAGRVLLNYLSYADRSRFETMVALPRGSVLKEHLLKYDAQIFEVDGIADRSFAWGDIAKLEKLIREVKPDIVHTHGALSGRIAAKKAGCRIVYTRHSAFPVPAKLKYPPGRWVNKLVNEFLSDKIIAVSPAAEQKLTDAGISKRRITTMMNGIVPVPRTTPAEQARMREACGVQEGEFVLGILARIEEYKGHLDILDAVAILRKQGRNVRLLIAGSGGFENAVREHCHKLGLDDCVSFLGFVSDVGGLLSIMDLQLNASFGTETSCLSVLEGMSMGLPAVVSDYGGNPWLIDDGEDGLLFPTRSAQGMSECIARLMDEPPTLARMQKRAVEIFNQRFTGEIFARNVEAVYDAAMKV
ncbi:MAG: glycosyltransferase [Oscillospiraceae bacterium]|nr:glycosyltransferase [Oscillospiraceae bacterium]